MLMKQKKQKGEYLAPMVKVMELSTRVPVLAMSGDTTGDGSGGYTPTENPGWGL